MTPDDQIRFGDVRSLLASDRFGEALRIAHTIAHPDMREHAIAHVQDAATRAKSLFEDVRPTLNFTHPSDEDALRMVRTFYPDDPFHIATAEPLMGDAMLVLAEFASSVEHPRSPQLLAHALLHRLSALPNTRALFGDAPYTPNLFALRQRLPGDVTERVLRLLVHGLMLESPWMDDRPDDAAHLAQDLVAWPGEGATFWSNTHNGSAYTPIARSEDLVLDELVLGVGPSRVVLFWAFGYD